uniref:Uncharacterized protein n=1 Tax=Rhizophora mucronata TaxID=61149 RepID=A0A2P2PEU2_RHIMU
MRHPQIFYTKTL